VSTSLVENSFSFTNVRAKSIGVITIFALLRCRFH